MQKVFIIEDEVLLRELITDVLKSHHDLEIIGAAGDGLEGMRQCRKLKPDFLILDLRVPSLNGIEISRQLRAEFPHIKILILSGVLNLGVTKQGMLTKPNGMIEKAAGLQEMEKAINAVASGQSYYSPAVVEKMPELLSAQGKEETMDALTAREREVLHLIAESHTTKEIADKLHIAVRTADAHRTHLMRKLGVHNVAGLTRLAIASGLVPVICTI